MKKIVLFVLILLTAFAGMAQDKAKIVGKWKVALIFDDKMYFDVKRDSLHMSNKDGAIPTQKLDSVQQQMKSMFNEMFKNSFVEFKADMTYIESSARGERKGTYTIDESTKTIVTKRERKSAATGETITSEEKINYAFKDNRLVFLNNGGEDPTVEFEKQ